MANNPNYEKCSAASDSILVKVIETGKAADIRIDVCPAFSDPVYLTRFLDSLAHNTVSWTKMSIAAPDVINPQTGEIGGTNLVGTFKYKYSLASNCGTSSAIAYLHPLKNRFTRHIDTIVICKDEKQSRSVHLNQILGLKIDGEEWTYGGDPLNPDGALDPYIKTFPTSSSYEGALIFDAYKAYSENSGKYGINYRGDTNAKAFVFQYKADNTCIGDINKKIVIVITEKMF
jgi:hypothetical protein